MAKLSALSTEEAARAVYVDVESYDSASEPALVGFCVGDSDPEYFVTDFELKSAGKARSIPIISFEQAIRQLLDKCIKENRKWVSFSEHELNHVRDHAGIDISDSYVNANTIARKWSKRESIYFPVRSLKEYAKKAGLEPEKSWMEGTPRDWMMKVRAQIRKNGDYKFCGKATKTAWSQLLWYNGRDCFYMRELVQKIVASPNSSSGR